MAILKKLHYLAIGKEGHYILLENGWKKITLNGKFAGWLCPESDLRECEEILTTEDAIIQTIKRRQ